MRRRKFGNFPYFCPPPPPHPKNGSTPLPGTRRSVKRTRHAFEHWTPSSTYRQFIICMFICQNFTPSKILFSNNHILQFYLHVHAFTSFSYRAQDRFQLIYVYIDTFYILIHDFKTGILHCKVDKMVFHTVSPPPKKKKSYHRTLSINTFLKL